MVYLKRIILIFNHSRDDWKQNKTIQIMLKFMSTFLQTKANLQWWAQRLILFSTTYLLVILPFSSHLSFLLKSVPLSRFTWIGSKYFPQTPPYMCLTAFSSPEFLWNLSEPFGLYRIILEWLSCTLFLSPQLNSKLSEGQNSCLMTL